MNAKFLSAACLVGAIANFAAAQPLVFEKHTIRDPLAVNQDAVSFLKPRGWKVEGGIKWYHNFIHLACAEVKVMNPNGLEQLETLPYVNCCWFVNAILPLPRGANYMGSIVHEPIDDPREVIEKLSLPQLRGKFNPRVVDSRELPEVAKALSQANGGAKVRSGRVRIEYQLNGQMVEEDIYLSLYFAEHDLGIRNERVIKWGPAWPPFALRAAKGKLDQATPLLLAIANSGRPEPRWFAEYQYVCSLFMNRIGNDIRNATEISDTIRRNGDEIFKTYSDAYWKRAASQERMSRNYSNYVRGVEQYSTPFERYPVQLPSGYKYAWAGNNGGYTLSNEAGFDPNVGGSTDWRLLKVAE